MWFVGGREEWVWTLVRNWVLFIFFSNKHFHHYKTRTFLREARAGDGEIRPFIPRVTKIEKKNENATTAKWQLWNTIFHMIVSFRVASSEVKWRRIRILYPQIQNLKPRYLKEGFFPLGMKLLKESIVSVGLVQHETLSCFIGAKRSPRLQNYLVMPTKEGV